MHSNLRAIVLAIAAIFATCATAADVQYLFIRGTKSGNIKGSVTTRGQEGALAVESVAHQVTVPRDIATGQASGKRQHKPLVVVVPVDQAWPVLMQALVNGEMLSQVVLRTMGSAPRSKVEVMQEVRNIELTNATLADIEEYTATNAKGEQQEFLKLSFTYQRIAWSHLPGRTMATDDAMGAR